MKIREKWRLTINKGVSVKIRETWQVCVSDWGNVMFTYESRFALEPDDKHIRMWHEQGTRN